MKHRRHLALIATLVLLLSCCLSSCQTKPKDQPEQLLSPEEARMAQLWEMTLELAASMSAGQVTFSEIRTDMTDKPLASVVADGMWDHLTYASGETVSHRMGREKPILQNGGDTLVMPEYFSPLEIDALPWRVQLPDTSALRRAMNEGAIPALTPSDMVHDVGADQAPILRVNNYFTPFILSLCYPVLYEGMNQDPLGWAELNAEMVYHLVADTLTLRASWTDDSNYGCGVAHRFSLTVSPDTAHEGQMTLTWEHTQTEEKAVPFSSLTPTLTSTGRVTEWVRDAQGLVSCTVEEERVGVCMDIKLLGDSMMRTETHATAQTRLTPREKTVLSQTVSQKTTQNNPAAGEVSREESLSVILTDRGDGTYDFRMDYDVCRDSSDRHFYAVLTP